MAQLSQEETLILGGLIRSYQENPESSRASLILHLGDEIRKENARLAACEKQYARKRIHDGNVRSEFADAFVNAEVEKGETLCQRHKAHINKLNRAQRMVQHNTFGKCVECDCSINSERLAVQIETSHCADCQNDLEWENSQRGRSTFAY